MKAAQFYVDGKEVSYAVFKEKALEAAANEIVSNINYGEPFIFDNTHFSVDYYNFSNEEIEFITGLLNISMHQPTMYILRRNDKVYLSFAYGQDYLVGEDWFGFIEEGDSVKIETIAAMINDAE